MARHGENIRKRKDGRWEGRYPVYCSQKEKKIYRSVYGATYEDVKKKLAERKVVLGERELPGKNSVYHITFANAAEEWLLEIQHKRKPSTYVKYHTIYQIHLKEKLGNVRVAEITDSFLRENIPSFLSESILKSIYCVLNQILAFAAIQYSIAISPLKKPVSNMRAKPVSVLSQKEQSKLLSVLEHGTDTYKSAVWLCLHTGLRLGELCALKWADIDFINHMITVTRTVQRLYSGGRQTKTVLLETEPKSEYSKRDIPLSCAALKMLISFQNNEEYIFGGNKALEPRNMQYHFKKILREAGVEDKNFHILRHTFATNCIEVGIDVKSLSEILGHSNVQITLNRYVHPSMNTKRKHLAELSAYYGQIYGHSEITNP